MKKYIYVLLPLFTGIIVLFLASFSGDNTDYPGGAPSGYTGSPFDNKDCTQCHGGNSSTVEGWITSDIPPAGYTPGTTYTITVTVSGSGKKGFEVSPHDLSGNLLGTLVAGSGNKLVGGGKYVTQSSSPTSNPSIWTFSWIAPEAGTGEVTFYGAFTVSEPVTKLSTLVVQESTLIPLTVVASATPQAIYYGDSTHLNVVASGGTGTFTYTWNSIPAGFLSNEQSPWAKPLEPTKYVALVSDGTQTVSDTVEVDVFPLGIGLANGAHKVTVFPNPAKGSFHVSVDGLFPGISSIRIYDITGRLIRKFENNDLSYGREFSVDLSGEKPGVYFVKTTLLDSEYSATLILIQ